MFVSVFVCVVIIRAQAVCDFSTKYRVALRARISGDVHENVRHGACAAVDGWLLTSLTDFYKLVYSS